MAAYTTNHDPSVLSTHSWRRAQNSAPHLLPHLKPDMPIKILDIGCGPGSITVDFASLVPNGHVIGIEYVSSPLDEARSLAKARGVTNVEFRVGDIHALEFDNETFDVVHVHQVLQHIADPVRALSEMRRVTKKGGVVSARESDSFSWYPENPGIQSWLDLTTTMAKEKGGNPHPGKMIHAWAVQAGFQRVKIERSAGTWCFSTPEERQYWGESMARRMEGSGLAEGAVSGGFASKRELEAIARGWREWVGQDDGWFGVLHGQLLCWK
ncbi:class I SAM-dependent methyltransferase [Aspergillus undulatus]|uniref:class I SAM-dependent methyltransferase n=1 Tax=Aspergillus undulatus TaxID=1810928 RepID=UPI003CCD1E36